MNDASKNARQHAGILLHPADNVITLLADRAACDLVTASLGEEEVRVVLRDDVRFGHKTAVVDIAAEEEIIKYGMPIGTATQPIAAGDWVHIHNCHSHRFGYHQEKYGVRA